MRRLAILAAIVALAVSNYASAQLLISPAVLAVAAAPSCDLSGTTYQTVTGPASGNGGSAHTESAPLMQGTATEEWAGFWLAVANTNSAYRGLVDVLLNGTLVVEDLYFGFPGTTKIFLPVGVPAGSEISLRWRGANANMTNVFFSLIGQRRLPGCPAGFAHAVALNADLGATRAGLVETTLDNTWSQQLGSTSRGYGALLLSAGNGATNPTTTQAITVQLGTGAGGSETPIAGITLGSINGFTGISGAGGIVLNTAIPPGTRLSARALGASSTTDSAIRIQIMGFW